MRELFFESNLDTLADRISGGTINLCGRYWSGIIRALVPHTRPEVAFGLSGDHMKLRIIPLVRAGLIAVSPCLATARDTGSVCIASVIHGEKSVTKPAQSYAMQIDERVPVTLTGHAVEFGQLALARKHLVKVTGDGKPVTSFHFSFADYQTHDLCLWQNDLYLTWSLNDVEATGKICTCRASNPK